MIDALVSGRLHGKPTERIGSNGKPFVTATVRTMAGEGEATVVNVISWAESVRGALLALDAGDSVALAGALTPKVWTPPQGEPRASASLVAHAFLTPYHVKRRRDAMAE